MAMSCDAELYAEDATSCEQAEPTEKLDTLEFGEPEKSETCITDVRQVRLWKCVCDKGRYGNCNQSYPQSPRST